MQNRRTKTIIFSVGCAAMIGLSSFSGMVVKASAADKTDIPVMTTESGQQIVLMPRGVRLDSIDVSPNLLFVLDEEANAKPRLDYIRSVSANISKSGSTATLTGAFSSSYTGSLTIRLQSRASSADSWEDVDSWSESYSSTGIHAFEKEYTMTKGNQYRVKVVAAVYEAGTLLESAYVYSKTISY